MISSIAWQRKLWRFQTACVFKTILWASIQNLIYFRAYTLWLLQMLSLLFSLHLCWISRFYFSSGITVGTISNFAGVKDHTAHNPPINRAAILIAVCIQCWGIWIPRSQGTTVSCQIIHYRNYKHCLAKCYYNHKIQLVITDLSAREHWNFSFLLFPSLPPPPPWFCILAKSAQINVECPYLNLSFREKQPFISFLLTTTWINSVAIWHQKEALTVTNLMVTKRDDSAIEWREIEIIH